MSYSLAVVDGDLVQEGSTLGIVWGIDKLKQDLALWVTERFGGDRFHPDMGSVLQDMIGGVIRASTSDQIAGELYRVLDNYQRLQVKALKENPQLLSLTEILFSIDDISVQAGYDTITATVKVHSAGGDSTSITFNQGL